MSGEVEVIPWDQPLSPVEVERQIREVTWRIEEGTEYVRVKHMELLESERALKREKAACYLDNRGRGMTIRDAECKTVLDTDPAREERDQAKAEYQYSRDWLGFLDSKLRGLQTQAAGLRVAYPMAGRGL